MGDVDVDGAMLSTASTRRRSSADWKHAQRRPAGRYLMVVHVHPDGISQMSVLEGRNLTEHYVSRPTDDETMIDGNISRAGVGRLPGMEAAFVDIGTAKNAVLYRADVAYDTAGDFEGNDRASSGS